MNESRIPRPLLLGAALALAGLYSHPTQAQTLTQTQELIVADGAAGDAFGFRHASEGKIMVVGAPFDDNQLGPDAGSVYVYERDCTGMYELIQMLTSPDGAADDHYGGGVDIDGDVFVVGARQHNGGIGPYAGAAYVYRMVDGTPVFEAKLAQAGQPYDELGLVVTIEGDTIFLSVELDNGGRGSVHVYKYIVDEWLHVQTLTAPSPSPGDRFGHAVAIDGDRAIIGSFFTDNVNGDNAGSAHVFELNTTWQHVEELIADVGSPGARFGHSVALDGTTAVIGAYSDDNVRGVDAGSAYVFEYTSGSFIETHKLFAPDGDPGDLFAQRNPGLDGNTLIIGSHEHDHGSGSQSGSAYVFHYDHVVGEWELEDELTADDAAPGDMFGLIGAAIDGHTVLIGAPSGDGAEADSGSVYVFSLDYGTVYCDESQNPNNTADISISGDSLSASSVLVSLSAGPPGYWGYLLIGNGNDTIVEPPGSKGDLCIAGGTCIGRYNRDVRLIDCAGGASTDISNTISGGGDFGIPTCGGNILPGETWYFQYWHRGPPTGDPATYSAALEITFCP